MKENREALRKYLNTNEKITLIATYEKEKKYGKNIRKLFVKVYITDTKEYVGHINIGLNEFEKKVKFKQGRLYKLTGYVKEYVRANGSESLCLDKVMIEKL